MAKCEDCNNCFLACKDEHVDNNWPGYALPQPRHGQRWINIMRLERGQYPLIDVAYRPTLCMHCDDAPCIRDSEGAIYKRNDGIVIIDPVKATGKKKIINTCPYKMIWWNETAQVAQKCTLCAHLLDNGWKEPRCVQSCPTGALRIKNIEDTDLNQLIIEENLEVLNTQNSTRPRVYYKNLYRYEKCFIAGSIATINETGLEECAEGAKITLFQNGEKLCHSSSDEFGDFKIDGLEKNSGDYQLEVELTGFDKQNIGVDLKESQTIETIYFNAKAEQKNK